MQPLHLSAMHLTLSHYFCTVHSTPEHAVLALQQAAAELTSLLCGRSCAVEQDGQAQSNGLLERVWPLAGLGMQCPLLSRGHTNHRWQNGSIQEGNTKIHPRHAAAMQKQAWPSQAIMYTLLQTKYSWCSECSPCCRHHRAI